MKKVVLVDLDGTYISCNSFHLWIKFIFCTCAGKLSFSDKAELRFILVLLFVLRKLRVISHSAFKRRVQQVWLNTFSEEQKQDFLKSFLCILKGCVSPKARSILDKVDAEMILLTTAAPEEYAKPFSIQEKIFDGCVSTSSGNSSNWNDNIRETKKRNTMSFLMGKSIKAENLLLLTDHPDDFPLIALCAEVYLFSPISRQIGTLVERFPDKTFRI